MTEQFDLSYFQERCSICFDNRLDFCLNKCRDQFCKECFSKYVETVLVEHSYGLSAPLISCPVCRDPLLKSEWAALLSNNAKDRVLVKKYEELTESFKSVGRACPSCGMDVFIVKKFPYDPACPEDAEKILEKIQEKLWFRLKEDDPVLYEFDNFMKSYMASFVKTSSSASPTSSFSSSTVHSASHSSSSEDEDDHEHETRHNILKLYGNVKRALEERSDLVNSNRIFHFQGAAISSPIDIKNAPNSPLITPDSAIEMSPVTRSRSLSAKKRRLSPMVSETEEQLLSYAVADYNNFYIGNILKLLVSLESSLDDWYKLVFSQLKNFYKVQCDYCGQKFCFQCGEATWHQSVSCTEYLKQVITQHEASTSCLNTSTSDEKLNNLRWKYRNGKQCPKCYTLITREEGCNKVDCTICGFKFCWICCQEWSEKCGFYKCRTSSVIRNEATISNPALSSTDEQTNTTELSSSSLRNGLSEGGPDESEQPDVDASPEIGVPDVKLIMQRLSTSAPTGTERNSLAV